MYYTLPFNTPYVGKGTQQNTLTYVFTDGGCKRNGNPNSKAAYSVFFTENQDSPFFKFNTSK